MDYNTKLHKMGIIWTSLALLMMASIPLAMCLIFKTGPDWKVLSISFLMLTAANLPTQLGEVFAYSYMLGTNGTYLAFVTGNLSNLKIPCVINAINIVGTKVGTEENELVSTISIAVSAIVTIVIIGLGVILFAPLEPYLKSETIKPAFEVVVFALFGALGGKYLIKYPTIALLPLIIIISLCLLLILLGLGNLAQASYMVFLGVILCFINAKYLGKKKKL